MRNVYFINPKDPPAEQLLAINAALERLGYSLEMAPEDVYLMSQVGDLVREHGVTRCLSFEPLAEAVLPDGIARDALVDTLRFKLNRLAPKDEFLLIDPYIFPRNADVDYVSFVEDILRGALQSIRRLHILTQANHDPTVAQAFRGMVKAVNPNVSISEKHSSVFHDRFWIADKSRGLFVGTSFNGVGRRYAAVDYLEDSDTYDIYSRFEQVP